MARAFDIKPLDATFGAVVTGLKLAALHLIGPPLGHRPSQIIARYAHLRTETPRAEREHLTLAIAPPKKEIAPPAAKREQRRPSARRKAVVR